MIVAGGAEMLVDQINTLVECMRRDLGEKVHYYEAQDAVHDIILFLFCEVASNWMPFWLGE
jgi:hypothetical protein